MRKLCKLYQPHGTSRVIVMISERMDITSSTNIPYDAIWNMDRKLSNSCK